MPVMLLKLLLKILIHCTVKSLSTPEHKTQFISKVFSQVRSRLCACHSVGHRGIVMLEQIWATYSIFLEHGRANNGVLPGLLGEDTHMAVMNKCLQTFGKLCT